MINHVHWLKFLLKGDKLLLYHKEKMRVIQCTVMNINLSNDTIKFRYSNYDNTTIEENISLEQMFERYNIYKSD